MRVVFRRKYTQSYKEVKWERAGGRSVEEIEFTWGLNDERATIAMRKYYSRTLLKKGVPKQWLLRPSLAIRSSPVEMGRAVLRIP